MWFKRDLRVHDSPALARAAATGSPVLPLYIAEPGLWRLPDASARQWAFIAESLRDLRAELADLGQPLVLRVGAAVEVLEALRAAHGITLMFSHEETGNGWTFARDRAVAAWARSAGVSWTELPQSGVVRRLGGRDGWQARRDGFMRSPPAVPPAALAPLPGVAAGPIPSATALGLAPDRCPHRQEGGRPQGRALLASFLAARGQHYRRAMSSPLAGERACSRLSAHLVFGTLSPREVLAATATVPLRRPGPARDWAGSLAAFRARLAWRDHFVQKLEDEPELEFRCLHPAYEGLRPRESDAARLRGWELGETGLPFVDACMRYLRASGWLNFRMRAMLVSVASYHLWLDWRASGPHLARLFTDYEPGIHWSQMQMQSGTTGTNAMRIYNPVKQGHDQDPAGRFTRTWVPELAEVPDRYLQTPWAWEGASRLLGRRYPEPLVDVAAAARAAADAVRAVRRARDFREQAARVLSRHGSRRPPPGRRRPPAAAAQMSFDF